MRLISGVMHYLVYMKQGRLQTETMQSRARYVVRVVGALGIRICVRIVKLSNFDNACQLVVYRTPNYWSNGGKTLLTMSFWLGSGNFKFTLSCREQMATASDEDCKVSMGVKWCRHLWMMRQILQSMHWAMDSHCTGAGRCVTLQ